MSGILLAEHSPPTACRRVVSGTISLPSQGFFSPFPHGTGSLSVAIEYLALPDGPGGFKQGFSCPALLRSHSKEDCIFNYAAVTLFGRPFQTVQLTLSCPSFHPLDPLFRERPVDDCGPATPSSPCGSPGLGSSEFARHYYRNHGRIDGKVVLITGASEGIGAACAREFASSGARLSLTARH